ncbi:MAG: CpsD/CapB family tyrosine-protein kinase [Pseudomonadota bacterium]
MSDIEVIDVKSATPISASGSEPVYTNEASASDGDVIESAFESLVILESPDSIEAEAIRGLRTRIMAQHVREGRRALAICSPTEDTGSSFVAANLATAMAQIGVKTLVVDANLRTPKIANMLRLDENAIGLSDYLADPDIPIDAILQETALPFLSVITAGSLRTDPQELLAGTRFKGFMDQLLREFELTILDTTATSRCTDAQRVATVAGYSLVVARKHKSHVKDVTTLTNLLRADRSNVIGTVLNDF